MRTILSAAVRARSEVPIGKVHDDQDCNQSKVLQGLRLPAWLLCGVYVNDRQ